MKKLRITDLDSLDRSIWELEQKQLMMEDRLNDNWKYLKIIMVPSSEQASSEPPIPRGEPVLFIGSSAFLNLKARLAKLPKS